MPFMKSGEMLDNCPHISGIDFDPLQMRVSTKRYISQEYHERERHQLWMKIWQIVCREDEIPEIGDWKEYRIFDQSYIVVRGRDDVIRGFVNSCMHRGNAICRESSGHAARFTCPYHNWTFGLDGALLAVAKPDFNGSLEEFVGAKEELGLIQVPVECCAGFVFLNPDRNAEPLNEYLGEIVNLWKPYHLEEMVPVDINVKETLACNWKVIMDAFQEGYHNQGIHKQLISVMDESKERYGFFGDHSVATAPFGASNVADMTSEEQCELIKKTLPTAFPATVDAFDRFDELTGTYTRPDGKLELPEGVTPRLLLQQATRECWEKKGLDVSGLTDNQMSDNQFHLIFPNLFLTIRAGEFFFISAVPHPDGDPNRSIWHTVNFQWLPPEQRSVTRAPVVEVPEGEHYPDYYLALEQDYEQMQYQQRGLRNETFKTMNLTKQEPRLAHFHSILDAWVPSS